MRVFWCCEKSVKFKTVFPAVPLILLLTIENTPHKNPTGGGNLIHNCGSFQAHQDEALVIKKNPASV